MKRKIAVLLFVLAVAVVYTFQSNRVAAKDAEKVAEDANPSALTCVTQKCHSGMGKEKFVHGPVAVGDCTSCHKPVAKHKFEPITDVSKLCFECHDGLINQQFVHTPVKNGQCTKCHNPHQSPNKFQLRAEGSDLCFLCHKKDTIEGGKFVHGPVAANCGNCHNTHQSQFPKLLFAKGNDVCFSCHSDKEEAMKASKYVHAPVQDSCINCHSPHTGNYEYNFKVEGKRELCFDCHTNKKQEIADATVPHKALNGERKCLTCHDPHFSNYVKQLTKQPADLCLGCHDREYSGPNGVIANMKAVLAENSDHHGPIRQGDCSGCHNAHGSKYFRILRENFPPLFYASYNPDNYKLCFMCHERSIAADETTTTLTSFRNGSQNLHYVHVHKFVKGRTCRACHDAHATNNPRHIRDKVPFANWQLPIGFKKTETGGSCSPGCHQKFSYDRVRPVLNRPATKP